MRVRIASRIYNSPSQDSPQKASKKAVGTGYDTNIFDQPDFRNGINGKKHWDDNDNDDEKIKTQSADGADGVQSQAAEEQASPEEQKVLDRIGEDLARLGRVKRVGLGVEDKIEFLKVWLKRRR